MLLSLNWLKNYVDIKDIDPNDLANKLTLAGIEVEKVYPLSIAENCVVGKVLEKTKHEQADKLSVCKVDLGNEVVQIVCGAQNVSEGQKVVVAKNGAILPGNIKIKKTKLRGVESNGMICSLKELGVESKLVPQEFQEGIVVLDDDATIGEDAIKYLGLDDVILELSLTPNRSDCLSMYGIAYEVAAILDKNVNLPYGSHVPYTIDNNFKVKIISKNCLLYYAKKIKGVKIKKSPQWLQSLLISCGIRPINNVVDVTNFVMLELGQPLHAFDLNKLDNKEILVRDAYEDETLVTLDGIKRDLLPSDLLITDGNKPIALAGVMGGKNTEIDDNTIDVLLESAVFDPLTIRNTYKRLNLRSEASIRFEKGIDCNRALYALNRAAKLLHDLADGKIDDKLAFASKYQPKTHFINITLDKINQVLGIELTDKDVIDALRRLKFNFNLSRDTFIVEAPSRRPDIMIQEDLIEEIIRIHGYEHLKNTLPLTNTIGELTPKQKKIRTIRNTLIACGLNDVITYSLTNEKNLNLYRYEKIGGAVKLLKPMSEDRSIMRQSIIHSLIEVISYNNARNIEDLLLFEIGKRYSMENNNSIETLILSGACTGNLFETKWQNKKEKVDFFFVKGVLETVFEKLSVLDRISYKQNTNCGDEFHPMRTANILLDNKVIGIIGQIHPKTQTQYDLKDTFVFELNLESLLDIETDEIKFTTISRYPNVIRDIAIVLDENITSNSIVKVIKDNGKKILKSVEVFDVYQGENVESNKKSVALSLVFENKEKTLTDEEVNDAYDRIVKSLEQEFSAYLRK